MGRHLSQLYGHVILVSGYPVLTLSCQLATTWMCNIWLQAPTLARKCEILFFIVQRNGWEDGHVTTKISWMDREPNFLHCRLWALL